MVKHSFEKGRTRQHDTMLPPKKRKAYFSFGVADTRTIPRSSSRHSVKTVDAQNPASPESIVDNDKLVSHETNISLSPDPPPFLQVPSKSACPDPLSIIPVVPALILPDISRNIDHSISTRDSEEEEVKFIGEVKRRIRPLQDYPHFRFHCGVEKSKKNALQKLRFCRNCYCFVCDVRASECKQWKEHAHAVDEHRWRNRRNLRRRLRDL